MKIEIVKHDWPTGGTNADGSPEIGPHYSFTVDGVPSLYWVPESKDKANPTKHIDRVIAALKAGRSREAFGDAGQIAVNGQAGTGSGGRGRVYQEPGPSKFETLPGSNKPREIRPPWRYELDGIASPAAFANEFEAKVGCAFAAFMTRGKLGQLSALQSRLSAENPGRTCKVFACATDHEVKATVDGKKVGIVWIDTPTGKTFEKFKA